MKNVILNRALFADALKQSSAYDTFCFVLNCTLARLHENTELYACLPAGEGIPCKLYVADSAQTVERLLAASEDTEWIEVTGNAENAAVCLCRRMGKGAVERRPVSCGSCRPVIPEALTDTMSRLSGKDNRVTVIHREKPYSREEKTALQQRSVVDLDTVDSRGVDILYFEGADKLIEKLLYGGCRELTVFVTATEKSSAALKTLDKLSRRAPFSNRITVAVGETYAPRTEAALVVGTAADLSVGALSAPSVPTVFLSVHDTAGEGAFVSVGQNTAELIPDPTNRRLKSHTLHYVTSLMSELILRAVTTGEYRGQRLFKVNAKTLMTETIVKED